MGKNPGPNGLPMGPFVTHVWIADNARSHELELMLSGAAERGSVRVIPDHLIHHRAQVCCRIPVAVGHHAARVTKSVEIIEGTIVRENQVRAISRLHFANRGSS